MRRRIFIAINLPEDVKKELKGYQEKWPELPCRWTKKDNLHVTLMFLGYVSDEDLLDVCKAAREAVLRHAPFSVKLHKIIYGPPKKFPPRMVWAEGEKSEELGRLYKDLEESVSGSFQKAEARPYAPHITLGRIRTWELKSVEPEERPDIQEEVNLTFEVNSIEVMESQLKKGGPEYAVLESIPLK